jgi:hypothetical protein
VYVHVRCEPVRHAERRWTTRTSDKPVLKEVISNSKLLKEEKKLKSENLILVLVHDLLLANGIQAGDGPVKQAILRHKTRLHSELARAKIKRGVKLNEQLEQPRDERAGEMESPSEVCRYQLPKRQC